MDAALLTSAAFWGDESTPLPDIPELAGHVLFETSGSSGNPKSVALSKQALLASATAVNRHLSVTPQSCWGLGLPLNHVGGFGVAARAYESGCRLATFSGRWNAEAFREWLDHSEVTHTSLVPTQVHDLVKSGLTSPPDLAAIVVGGGHLDQRTGQAARDLGWPVLASYGMTEAASQIATQGLGQLDFPYQPAPLPLLPIWQAQVTAAGLLSLSGPALFSGYVTGKNFSPRGRDWHVTLDRGALDGRMLTPLGRADLCVKILGELVDPEAIEREILRLAGSKIAPGTFAVVAVPDERAGFSLVPVFEAPVDLPLVESILATYEKSVPGFRRLRPAMILETFTRSELGKLKRAELTALCEIRCAS